MEENNQYGAPVQGAEFGNPNIEVEPSYEMVEDNTYVGETVVTATVEQAPVEQAQVVEQPVAQAEPAVAPPQKPAQPEYEEEIPAEDLNLPKITVRTDLLKSALQKADAVAGKNELQPVTEVVVFGVANGKVQLRSSDKDNVVTVYIDYIEATEGASMTLKLEEIKPLVDKLKCEKVTFILRDRFAVLYAGSGVYNFNYAIDLTTNQIITIPDIEGMGPIPKETSISMTKEKFLTSIEQVFPLISGIDKDSQYAAVHIGSKVTTSSGDEVAVVFEDIASMFNSTIFLKSTTVKEIIAMGLPEKFLMGLGELNGRQTICIYTDDYRLYSVAKENEDEYPAEDIENLLASPVGASLTIKKSQLLDAIDRLGTMIKNTARKTLDFEKVGSALITIICEKGREKLVVAGNGDITTKLDSARLVVVTKAINTEDIIFEPITDGDGPVSFIRISSSDKKQSFVIGATLQ